MDILDINLGKLDVGFYQIQSRMSQKRLQGEHISAIPQVGNSKGMPEPARVAVSDPCLVSQVNEQLTDDVVLQPPAIHGLEESADGFPVVLECTAG